MPATSDQQPSIDEAEVVVPLFQEPEERCRRDLAWLGHEDLTATGDDVARWHELGSEPVGADEALGVANIVPGASRLDDGAAIPEHDDLAVEREQHTAGGSAIV